MIVMLLCFNNPDNEAGIIAAVRDVTRINGIRKRDEIAANLI